MNEKYKQMEDALLKAIYTNDMEAFKNEARKIEDAGFDWCVQFKNGLLADNLGYIIGVLGRHDGIVVGARVRERGYLWG